jgi:hypothetical protein
MLFYVLLIMSVFGNRFPVILVPGLTGSQIEYKKKEDEDWKVLWFDSFRTIIEINDYINQLSVNYNPKTYEYSSNGVFTRPYDFEGVNGIDHLDSSLVSLTYYFHCLINFIFFFYYFHFTVIKNSNNYCI